MPALFDPLTLRGVTLRNRIGMSPMCQYIAGPDGVPTDWHLTHLCSRAAGGAGLVMTEVSAVEPIGRIGPGDTGIWSEDQVTAWKRITDQIRALGAVPAMQIGHAGRKASVYQPWVPGKGVTRMPPRDGGWTEIVGPSAVALRKTDEPPQELSPAGLARIRDAFREGARRADRAGFDCLELHGAHGYLLASFLSPFSNKRSDQYGGALANRMRFPLECFSAMREVFPERKIIGVRLSCTEWIDGGQTIEDAVEIARAFRQAGADFVDCSSGVGATGGDFPVPPASPGYQVPFAERIRREAQIPTAAVGLITEPSQADAIVRGNRADIVLIGRAMLRDPYWALRAAEALGSFAGAGVDWPLPYGYAVKRR